MKELRIVSVSGGKDSTALYLLCMDYFGNDFLPIFADTGNEHPVTINYVKNLHFMTGGPEVVIVTADFSRQINSKRKKLIKDALSAPTIDEAKVILAKARRCKPTGKPFHDLLRWKGRAPSSKAQFCTEHLKLWPIYFYLHKHYPKNQFNWQMFTGIRAGESFARSRKQPFAWNSFFDCENILPLLYEDLETVFLMLALKKVAINPLYTNGKALRVGCYPCINSSKPELRNLEEWAWDKLKEFEEACNGRTWFPPNKIPSVYLPNIDQVKEWVQTSRGGNQFNMFLQEEMDNKEDTPSCMTGFMICE